MPSRTQVMESRRFDHVYDLTHTSSSQLDYVKSTDAAAKLTFVRVPHKTNMFSQIPLKYKTHTLRISKKVDLPRHIDGSTMPTAPPIESTSSKQVSGFNRAKFFRRPMAPILQSIPPHILLAKADMDATRNDDPNATEVVSYSRVKDVGMQTMYRESEAQTDPFTPEYTIVPGSDPEVLKLQHMKHSTGDLPANLREVELIERMRTKRSFEQSLPPITDEASFLLRRSLMEKLELFQFQNRNKDIDEVQKARIDFMKKALQTREAEKDFNAEQRVEQLRRRELVEKDHAIAAIQRNRIKALRKLTRARLGTEPLVRPGRDIIKEYSEFSSRVYAPILREGQVANVNNAELNAMFAQPKDVFQLEELEKSIPEHLLHPSTHRRNPKHKRLTPQERRKQHIRLHLDRMDAFLKKRNGTGKHDGGAREVDQGLGEDATGSRPFPRKQEKRVERPGTPRLQHPSSPELGEEEYLCAVQLLQRLVKGRAVQNAMYYGKEKRLHLINELRTAEMEKAEESGQERRREIVMDSIFAAICDAITCRSLQQLSNEKKRAVEGAHMERLMEQAEELRRVREVEELGRRQSEESKRQIVQDMTYQAIEVQRAAVDSFLDETIQNVIVGLARGGYGGSTAGEASAMEVSSLRELAKATAEASTSAAKVKAAKVFHDKPEMDDREYLKAAQNLVLETMKAVNLES